MKPLPSGALGNRIVNWKGYFRARGREFSARSPPSAGGTALAPPFIALSRVGRPPDDSAQTLAVARGNERTPRPLGGGVLR